MLECPTHQLQTSNRSTTVSYDFLNLWLDSSILETPPSAIDFIGRGDELSRLNTQLNSKRALLIFGLPGVGKTWLAAKLAQQHQPESVFWYTFWPRINDSLTSVWWQLAIFMHRQGYDTIASNLVDMQVRLDKKIELLLGALSKHEYLFCFDQVEASSEEPSMVILLQSLYELSLYDSGLRVILSGRVVPGFLDSTGWEPLKGFGRQDTATFLNINSVLLTNPQIDGIFAKTSGYPGLLDLFVDWVHQTKRTHEEVAQFVQLPSICKSFKNYLLETTDRYLGEDERSLIQLLSLSRDTGSYSLVRSALLRFGLQDFDGSLNRLIRKGMVRIESDNLKVDDVVGQLYQHWLIQDIRLKARLTRAYNTSLMTTTQFDSDAAL